MSGSNAPTPDKVMQMTAWAGGPPRFLDWPPPCVQLEVCVDSVPIAQRAADEPVAKGVVHVPVGHEMATHGIFRPEHRRGRAVAPRRACRGRRGEPAQRSRERSIACGERGVPMPRVAAEQLVRALAGERDGDVLRGELGEREEAERREVGERLVEVPDELGELDVLLGERELELVVVGAEELARRTRASASSLPSPASAKPTENVLTGSVMWRAISATIRLESRPPLSIAPSGTSLISRSRTDSSSRSSSSLARTRSALAARSGAGLRVRPVRARRARRPRSTTSRCPGISLRTPRERRQRRRARSRA